MCFELCVICGGNTCVIDELILKENLDIKKAAIFLTTSIIGIMTFNKVKNNTSYSRPSMEMLVQQMMSWRNT